MNNKKKVSLISVGIALAITPLVIWGVRKLRGKMNQDCCDHEASEHEDGRKRLFGGWKNKRGHREVENLEG